MSSSLNRGVCAFIGALFALTWSWVAGATVPLCLEVKADAAEQASFEKLVRSELGRHPGHRLATQECDSHLLAELFRVGNTRYLTLRIDAEIPLRYSFGTDRELEIHLSEGMSRVLRSDPAYLAEDPSRLSGTERAVRAVLVHGSNTYRLSFSENIARTDTGFAYAPGVAFEIGRGAGHFGVFAKTGIAYSLPSVRADERALNLLGRTEAGLAYEFAPRRTTSAYAAVSAGALLLRFQGRTDPADERSVDSVMTAGAMLAARVGVRFLRVYDFDCDAFASLVAPLFATKNPDSSLFGEHGTYTPIAELGLGVGF